LTLALSSLLFASEAQRLAKLILSAGTLAQAFGDGQCQAHSYLPLAKTIK